MIWEFSLIKTIFFRCGEKLNMATLEKLIRAFEAVKNSQISSSSSSSESGVGVLWKSDNSSEKPTEHTSAMASLASTFSQQGQGLLRLVLNSKKI